MKDWMVIALFAAVPGLFTYLLARLRSGPIAAWVTIFTCMACAGLFMLETMAGQGAYRYLASLGLLLPASLGCILGLFIGRAPWKNTAPVQEPKDE